MLIKPKFNTIFSLLVFLSICYIAFFVMLFFILTSTEPSVFLYVMMPTLGLFGLIITARIVTNYKVIKAEQGKVEVKHTFLFRTKTFNLRDLKEIKEEQIKTFGNNNNYKHLNVRFENGMFTISNQEYNEYDKFKKFLQKNKRKFKK